MILTALHEGEVPSNVPNEELGRNSPDLYHVEPQSEVQNQGEREDHGPVAERPPEAAPERISGEDTLKTIQSGKSRGECLWSGTTLACTHPY